MDKIRFTRQPDGTYTREGELPKGTRYAMVTWLGGFSSAVKRVQEWLNCLEQGPLTKDWYEVLPAISPKGAMSIEAKEKLAAIAEQRRQERAIR